MYVPFFLPSRSLEIIIYIEIDIRSIGCGTGMVVGGDVCIVWLSKASLAQSQEEILSFLN